MEVAGEQKKKLRRERAKQEIGSALGLKCLAHRYRVCRHQLLEVNSRTVTRRAHKQKSHFGMV